MQPLYTRLLLDIFNGLPWLILYPPPHDIHFKKVSNPWILAVPADFKTPLNLTLTNKYQLEFSSVNTSHTVYLILTSTCLFLQLSILLHTWLFLTLCPVTILLFAVPLTFCIPYQMLVTSLIWKHIYSYISENNFGPSNQITVPTSYKP